jgi:transposase-like protein
MTYEQLMARHERELKEWCEDTLRGKKSITSAAKAAGVNPGTFWRIAVRLGVLKKKGGAE